MQQLFFYGTLCDPALLAVVLGRDARDICLARARLPGFRVAAVKGRAFPMLCAEAAAEAEGILVRDLSALDIARLEFYEGAYLFALRQVDVTTATGDRRAAVFMADDPRWTPGGAWHLDAWIKADAGVSVEAAHEVMANFGARPAGEVYRHYPNMRMRAQSRLNAARDPAPVILRQGFGAGDVKTDTLGYPYLNFFTVEERTLQFRKFSGDFSAPVTRAAFVGGDAVTVLPYDPVRDLVLLIEQFRAGPMARNDPCPWTLEPVAGRQDVGETPAMTARRELAEETGYSLKSLEKIAGYYSSPGAYSEYLLSYLAIADLDPARAGVHGLEAEAEDIRTLIVPFDTAMEALETGEADNGPLLVSLLWLARNRARLRKAHAGA